MRILKMAMIDAANGQRSHALDGLRGLAAVAVIFYHAVPLDGHALAQILPVPIQDLTGLRNIATKIVLSVFSGSLAVLLFFVLSGFVLKLSFDRMQGPPSTIVYNFVVRRLCRIVPTLLFALLLCHVLASFWISVGLPGSGKYFFRIAADPGAILQNALLWKTRAHGATWTLQAEMVVIPFLLGVLFISRTSAGAMLGCLLYAVLAMKASFLVAGAPRMSPFLAAFVAGVLAADPRFKTLFLGMGQRFLIALLAALLGIKLFLPPDDFPVKAANVMLAMLLVGGIHYAAPSTPLIRALSSRAVQFLGRVSYSLYLVNVPLIWVFLALTPTLGLDRLGAAERGVVMGLCITLLSLPIAALSERTVERSGIRLGKRLSIRREGKSSAAPVQEETASTRLPSSAAA